MTTRSLGCSPRVVRQPVRGGPSDVTGHEAVTAWRGSRRAPRRLRARAAWPGPEAGCGGRFVAGWTGECAGSYLPPKAAGSRLSRAASGRERSEPALGAPGMARDGGESPQESPYWRESNVRSNCTSPSWSDPAETVPVRGCGMEARNEPQHRTRVNSGAGRPVWVSVPRNATPGIQSRQDGIGSGSGGKSRGLTLGDLHQSAESGRSRRDVGTMLVEKSDHPIRAMKPGNAGGAKGVTG